MMDPSMRPEQPDGLDGLLRAYFRNQVPQPWPAAPFPPARTLPFRLPGPQSGRLRRSRLALAASVAILTLGAFFAAGKIAPESTPGLRLKPGEATLPTELRHSRPERIRTSMSLEQDPAGPTIIRVDAIETDGPPPR